MLPLPGSHHSQFNRIWGAVSVLALIAAGCQQVQKFPAAHLPPDLVAPRPTSLQDVDLWQIAPSTNSDGLLSAGDLVEITVAADGEDCHPPTHSRVGQDGAVVVHLVGPVRIAGLTPAQAEQHIRDETARRGELVEPTVSLVRLQQGSKRVTIVGAVKRPGTYELPATAADALNALVMAGGVSEQAGTLVELRHPPRLPAVESPQLAASHPPEQNAIAARTLQIDLEKLSHSSPEDLRLHDGSTVMVMQQPQQYIHVIGLVQQEGQFEIPENQELQLLDALALAGGRRLAIADKVHVIRTLPSHVEPIIITASIREARSGRANIRLAAGDVVSVEETPATFVFGTICELIGGGRIAGS